MEILALKSSKPIIIVEGKHDQPFVVMLAKLFGISTEGVQFLNAGARFTHPSQQRTVIELIKRVQPDLKIRFLRDPDFFLGVLSERIAKEQREISGTCTCNQTCAATNII